MADGERFVRVDRIGTVPLVTEEMLQRAKFPAGQTASERVSALLDEFHFTPCAEPVEITYMSDAPRVPNLIVGGDLHAEWSMPMSAEEIEAAITAANDLVEQYRAAREGDDG